MQGTFWPLCRHQNLLSKPPVPFLGLLRVSRVHEPPSGHRPQPLQCEVLDLFEFLVPARGGPQLAQIASDLLKTCWPFSLFLHLILALPLLYLLALLFVS